MPKFLFTKLFLFFFLSVFSQKVPDLHVVELSDKNGSEYSIHAPWEFLSARALERRKNAGIAITESDLPVNNKYLDQIRATGARIKTQSKWMNSALVIASPEQIQSIEKLSFVLGTTPVGYQRKPKPKPTIVRESFPSRDYIKLNSRYGNAKSQIRMLQGHIIHLFGNQGEGKLVAVMDGGFVNAHVLPVFDSIRVKGNMLPSKDFVDSDGFAYEDSGHGTQVLSTMAANLPGLMVGTAPHASYVCIKTEEIGAENPVEEEYWIAGLEYADSLGADVVNSSLGYTTFDLKDYNHLKENLDGQTYRASIAASIGANKGILIFNSAGNEGSGKWSKIGVPADAFDIIAVGAVSKNRRKASFSSYGPTADGRIKPNLSAMGRRTAVSSLRAYDISTSNGTSFSSPVLAGMSTSLWSAFPEKSWSEVKDALVLSGSKYMKPDSLTGYGIPDFTKAYAQLSGIPIAFHHFDSGTRIFKQGENGFRILFRKGTAYSSYVVRNSLGQVINMGSQKHFKEMGLLDIELGKDVAPGVYQVIIESGELMYFVHLVHL